LSSTSVPQYSLMVNSIPHYHGFASKTT
jgi:hypothetical protein